MFFPWRFFGPEHVQVHLSIYDSRAFVGQRSWVPWVESVTKTNFLACIVRTGANIKVAPILNWLAFQGSPANLRSGSVVFEIFSVGTRCETVEYSKVLLSINGFSSSRLVAICNAERTSVITNVSWVPVSLRSIETVEYSKV